MKTVTNFIYAAFAVLTLAMGAVTANGAVKGSRPHPTPAPRPTPPLTADLGSSYSNDRVPYAIDVQAILTSIGHPDLAAGQQGGYTDLNGDGIPDVVFGGFSGNPSGGPMVIACGQPGGGYIDCTTQVISGEVPAPIKASMTLVADFNGDGWPDLFIVDFGLDADPFPGSHDWLLLSDGTGHLVYQSAFSDPVGSHHDACAGDIDHSGHIDIFVENQHPNSFHYFLINDGQGHFTIDTTRVPSSLGTTPIWNCQLIDVDSDNNLDLVVGGTEEPTSGGLPTEIFWGDGSGFYSDANKTVLPAEPAFDTVLDFYAEDINHDGLRDLVINRTDPFYTSFYYQVLMQTSRRVFADESLPRLIHDLSTWIGNNYTYTGWKRLVDMTGDGAPDLLLDGGSGPFAWANDGNGYFTLTDGWSKVIWTTPLLGSTFSPPAPGTYSYDLNWDKPVDPASVQPTDLRLDGIQGATVTGVAVIHENLTTEFTLDIPTGGSLRASIPTGTITSQTGQPNVAFLGSYTVATPPRPGATPRPHPTPPPRN